MYPGRIAIDIPFVALNLAPSWYQLLASTHTWRLVCKVNVTAQSLSLQSLWGLRPCLCSACLVLGCHSVDLTADSICMPGWLPAQLG